MKRATEEVTVAVPQGSAGGGGDDLCSNYDYNCDCKCECECESISLLDDNGFPPFQLLQESEDQGSVENTSDKNGNDDQPIEIENRIGAAEEETSFASDFYRCGTDWSCLLKNEENNNPRIEEQLSWKRRRTLKQTTLFHMWGFHKNPHHDAASSLPPRQPSISSSSSFDCLMKSNEALILRRMEGNNSSGGSGVAHNQRPRVCPFYKKIPGTPFTVDAFRYGCIEGCSAYILSHFHADHYGGLSKGWSYGPIYCTPLTARLVRLCLSVDPSFIHPLELGKEYVIEEIRVTMLEANHCPGAALMHFRLPNGQCYLHTGDFRACKLMQAYPLLTNQRVNVLYLDTTYCNPKYRFPSREDVLSFVVQITKNCLEKQPKTLVIVGAYSIGKESVFLAISKALGVKVYANAKRRRILQSFGWPELSGNLCSHGKDTLLHVLPISSLRFEILDHYCKTYMNQYTAVLAFRPTGWTYSEAIGNHLDLIEPRSKGIVTIYGVPYSEHSSFTELQEFVQFLRPGKIIPTVNIGNAANRDKMQLYFRGWLKG
ncbi:hypothetical protein F0562_004751 [Nyssa sinensis]|uniref:Metallo-beta-lactamase domain-containing protein n=1 Tax=Nyssa sinensis TaxID=561372 RepID=A0A5J5AJT1_9ASTE|nr:hypothetical protein F0562_004751 [Nyssa sinensis]